MDANLLADRMKRWEHELTTEGARQAFKTISNDIKRGLYFQYLTTRLNDYCDFDTEKIVKIEIDPREIVWESTAPREILPKYGPRATVGELGGNWDIFKRRIEGHEPYITVKNTYREGGNSALIKSLERNGYLNQYELEGNTCHIRDQTIYDEPRLAVGRNGEFIRWTGGLHRIAAAQIIGIDAITVYVVVWHKKVDRDEFLLNYKQVNG